MLLIFVNLNILIQSAIALSSHFDEVATASDGMRFSRDEQKKHLFCEPIQMRYEIIIVYLW